MGGPRTQAARADRAVGGRRWAATVLALACLTLGLAGIATGAPVVPPGSPAPLTITASDGTTELGLLAAAPDGSVWFSEPNAASVARVAPDGTLTEFPTGAGAGSGSLGVVAGPDGNMWFTLQNSDWGIARVTPNGTVTTFDPVPAGSLQGGIAVGADGNLWFSSGTSIDRITTSGAVTSIATGLNVNDGPAVAEGPDGNIWFAETPGNGKPAAIGKITPLGDVTLYTSGLPASSSLGFLAGGPDGDLWFADLGAQAIGRITPTGQITEFDAGLLPASLPLSLAVAPDGNLWFTDVGVTEDIGEITPDGTITEWTPSGGFLPIALATGPDGKVWITGRVGATGTVAELDVGAPAALAAPPEVDGGVARQGILATCDSAAWSDWAGTQPSTGSFDFDGYRWLLDGSPIAGAAGPSYRPLAADVGHALACTETVTYGLLGVTVEGTSATVTVQPQAAGGGSGGGASGGGGGGGGGGAPNLHVAVDVSSTPHTIGDQFNYLIAVTNTGGASNDSTLTVNLPSQVSYQGARVDRGPGCAASGQTITCNLDFFPPGLTTTVSIGARIAGLGTATLTTTTYSSPGEYDPADSAVAYTLSLAALTPPPASTAPLLPLSPGIPRRVVASLKLSGLRVVAPHSTKPSVRFGIAATLKTRLTIELLAGHAVLARRIATARKGSNVFELPLPPKLRGSGWHTLEILEPGSKPRIYTFTLKT